MMSGSPMSNGGVPQPPRSEPLAPSPGVAPFLRKPVAPFAGRSRRRRAATGAMFYAECSLQGISAKEADDAAKDSQAHFQNWWLQDRFKKKPAGGGKDDVGGGCGKVRRGKRDSSNGGPKSRGGDARRRDLEPRTKLPRIPETPAGESQTESGESQCESGEVSRRKRRRSFLDSISGPAGGRDPSPPAKRRDGSDDEGDGVEDYENSSNSSMPSSRGTADEDAEAHQQSGEASTSTAPAPPAAMEEADIITTTTKAAPVIPEELTALSEEMRAKRIEMAKAELLEALAENDGETTGPRFLAALEVLKVMYSSMGVNACDDGDDGKQGFSALLDGVWLTMSKPNFHECLGKNPQGEYKYTLGRMSFDMFLPTKVVCSIQGVFNPVFVTETIPDAVPRTLRKEIQSKNSTLRTYNIVVAFTVDEESLDDDKDKDKTNEGQPPKRKRLDETPLQGVMTTYGYILPDPNVPNRVSVWFTGGVLEANDETDVDSWERVFGGNLPKRALKERARLLAAKLLLGASAPDGIEEDGSMSYYLKRPIGGHGVVYCDVLYLDESLRIMRGHHGTIYVTSRVPPCYAD